MSDPAIKTAEVEVLTAEVRVLMVGSRQITLSVARQLDQVPLLDVEPFGRVRLGTTTESWHPHIIGKHRHSGVLVIASYDPTPSTRPSIIPRAALVVCAHWARTGTEYPLMYEQRSFSVHHDHTVSCVPHRLDQAPKLPGTPLFNAPPEEQQHYRAALETWHTEQKAWKAAECLRWEATDATKRDLVRQLDAYDAYRAACLGATILPLIVLAGLR